MNDEYKPYTGFDSMVVAQNCSIQQAQQTSPPTWSQVDADTKMERLRTALMNQRSFQQHLDDKLNQLSRTVETLKDHHHVDGRVLVLASMLNEVGYLRGLGSSVIGFDPLA